MNTTLVTLGLVALSSACWVILLAAVASMHSLFSDIISDSGLSEVLDTWIADYMGLTWWVVWYQFALLVVIAVASVAGKLHKLAMILLSLLASLLALLMLETHEAGRLFRSSDGAVVKIRSRTTALLAGTILSSGCTLLLIIWIGLLPNDSRASSEGFNKARNTQGTSSGVQQYVAEATGSTVATEQRQEMV